MNAIVDSARSYVGTPFHHQGTTRGVGIDCVGLLTCVMYDCGIMDLRLPGYSIQPDPDQFRKAMRQYLDPIQYADVRPGDVLTFAFVAEQHIGIVSRVDPIWIIHAYQAVERCLEQPLESTWARRLRGCYRFRKAAPWPS